MRPIYQPSTDLIYSPFPLAELMEIANAVGYPDIKYITTATLSPERALYHCCLNGIQTRLKLSEFDERKRGQQIAVIAAQIYEYAKPKFKQALDNQAPSLVQKKQALHDYVLRLEQVQQGSSWDSTAFAHKWKSRFSRPRWQLKAIETYQIVSERIAVGEYIPSPEWNALQVTRCWGERNLEYKHYRDIGRQLVDEYFAQYIPLENQLTRYPTYMRKSAVFFGAIGSGKTHLAKRYLAEIPEPERFDRVYHDADCLKYALAIQAINDGKIETYTGPEVQNESSNALYEGSRKRYYRAITKGRAPNVLLTSTVANELEINELLEGGGSIKIFHISVSLEVAVSSNAARAKALGRKAGDDHVGWSSQAAASSLLDLFDYAKAKIIVHVYEREKGKDFSLVATIDCRNLTANVYDMHGFIRAGERADIGNDSKEKSQSIFKTLFSNGFTLNWINDQEILYIIKPDYTFQKFADVRCPEALRELINMEKTMSEWMINENDPARLEIVRRAVALGITGAVDRASHTLGSITLADGKIVNAHVIHAVDPVITDGSEVVMINRKNEPGKGKPALPGGWIDPSKGGVESAVQGAAREALEEAFADREKGDSAFLGEGHLIGTRNMNRPFDVRVATKDLPSYGIKKDDVFMVSTQAVRFDVPGLANTNLKAGDDATPGSARRVAISSLTRDYIGIPDHFDMIVAACPECFRNVGRSHLPADHKPRDAESLGNLGPGNSGAFPDRR